MRLLREPLLHFVLLGLLLLAAYALAGDLFSSRDARTIAIAQSDIEILAAGFERQWQRPPTEDELRALVDSRIREEVLYREALAVGLDRNDPVVRRRMVQKMEMLSQDIALLADPTDEQLRSFFDEHREDYRFPPRVSFSHVYFNADRRGPAAAEDARRTLAELRALTPPPRHAPDLGDRFMLDHDYTLQTPLDVRQSFGNDFAEALFQLEPGWQGPVASGYGIHLVNVTEREESRVPEFQEIRDRLVLDFDRVRRERANEALYEGLSSKYRMSIDEEALRRVALSATER